MIKLLLVDDQPNVRRALRMRLTLEPDLVVVGEAGDGAGALSLAAEQLPDVVVMDVEMPGIDGITATEALLASLPQTRVVIVSIHDDCRTRERAEAAGATAFVSKTGCGEDLVAAVRRAMLEEDTEATPMPGMPAALIPAPPNVKTSRSSPLQRPAV